MKSVELNFDYPNDGSIHHKYQTRMEGDWIVFTCPKCPGHQRRLNLRTHQMMSKGVNVRRNIRHSGFHIPIPKELN